MKYHKKVKKHVHEYDSRSGANPQGMQWEGEVTCLEICIREPTGKATSEARSVRVGPRDFWKIAPFVCLRGVAVYIQLAGTFANQCPATACAGSEGW